MAPAAKSALASRLPQPVFATVRVAHLRHALPLVGSLLGAPVPSALHHIQQVAARFLRQL